MKKAIGVQFMLNVLNFKRVRLANCAALALCLTACASTNRPPRWVSDIEAAYPRAQWLTALETGYTRQAAESAALASLASGVRVDIAAVTKTSLAYVQHVQQNGAQSVVQSADFHALAQEVSAASNVAGLTGVEKDFWTSPAGEVYALVRMNRAQCAARYAARIAENEAIINNLTRSTAEHTGTLDGYANLAFAAQIAELTDSFITILSILTPEKAGYSPTYGGTAQVKTLVREAAARITVRLTVKGDIQGRLEKAFAKVITARGFRAGASGATCTLTVICTLEESPQSDGNFAYARITVSAALAGSDGREIFAWNESDRQGHINITGARERALAQAESLITETSFAPALDAALATKLYF